MPQSISPYALLRQSKPKPAYAPPTPYDLYSMTVQENPPAPTSPPDPVSIDPLPEQRHRAAPVPMHGGRRTHYIADIHARHSTAIQRSPQDSRPL